MRRVFVLFQVITFAVFACLWDRLEAEMVDFDRAYSNFPLYDEDELDTDFNTPPWENGVDEGHVTVVNDSNAYSGNSLAVLYPQGSVGPSGSNPGGAQWRWEFDDNLDDVHRSDAQLPIPIRAEFRFRQRGKAARSRRRCQPDKQFRSGLERPDDVARKWKAIAIRL